MFKKIIKIALLTGLCLCLFQTAYAQEQIIKSAKGEILNITAETIDIQYKDQKVEIRNDYSGNPYEIAPEKGDKVTLYIENRPEGTFYFIQDYWHLDWILIWGVIFLITIIALGRWKGVKAILSLGISLLLIFFILLPAIKKGYNPIIIAIAITTSVSIITIILITGFNKKAATALIGTFGGTMTATILTGLIGITTRLNGLGTEDSRILAINFPEFNFKGILFAGIIIGALGAVMDTAMSITSGLEEIKKHKPNVTSKELMKSGLEIGRDIMGSMLNTLIFAYIGASLTLILLFTTSPASIAEILNFNFISEEIVRSLAGSIGLLATIPITAIASGMLKR